MEEFINPHVMNIKTKSIKRFGWNRSQVYLVQSRRLSNTRGRCLLENIFYNVR